MGGINGGDYVKKEGITRANFETQLKNQGVKEQKLNDAMSVFDRYAESNNAEGEGQGVLNTIEQGLVRDKFSQMDINNDGTLTKKEFKQQGEDINYKVYKQFINAFNNLTSSGEIVTITEDTDKTDFDNVEHPENPQENDVQGYRYTEEPTAPPTPQPTPEFKDNDAVKKIIYQYLSGNNNLTDEDIENMDNMNALNGLTFDVKEGGTDKVEVKFGDKVFILHKTANGQYSIDSQADADGNGTTLQDEILNSETTDVKHNYRNRYGIAGNSQSNYGNEGIINTSRDRQHVNPVQTFTSMVLNNTEDSSLTIDKGLTGENIIAEINKGKGDNEKVTEISMHDLIKYIKAAVKEAGTTTSESKNFGTRTAAKDVDFDLKDLTNLGIVFKKYDKDGSGKLDKGELDNLINDLTHGKTMTGIAKASNEQRYTYNKPDTTPTPNPHHDNDGGGNPNPTPPKFKPHYGAIVSKPDHTRHSAGTNKDAAQDVSYVMDGGRRILVEKVDGKWRTVENQNIAEFQDHGFMGAGNKDFIKINGLSSNVRAKVVGGRLRGNMVIEIKDTNGNKTYRQVTPNGDGTYTLGELVDRNGHTIEDNSQQILNDLGMTNVDGIKIPQDLAVEKKHGKTTYKIKGREVNADVARSYIRALNSNPEVHHINGPKAKGEVTAPQQNTSKNTFLVSNAKSTVITGDNNKPTAVVTNISDFSSVGFSSYSAMQILDGRDNGSMGFQYSSREIQDKNGRTLIRHQDGKFYDANNRELSRSEAQLLLVEISTKDKYKSAKIVQFIKQNNQPEEAELTQEQKIINQLNNPNLSPTFKAIYTELHKYGLISTIHPTRSDIADLTINGLPFQIKISEEGYIRLHTREGSTAFDNVESLIEHIDTHKEDFTEDNKLSFYETNS